MSERGPVLDDSTSAGSSTTPATTVTTAAGPPIAAAEGRARRTWRVAERELHIYRQLWHGSVFTYFVGPAMYLGAMGIGLGGLVDERGGLVGNLPYVQFVAPGLLAATVMQSAAADSLWPIMGGMKWMRQFHALAATPLTPADIYLGHLLWMALRMTMSAAIFVVVATVLGGVASPWAVLAVVAAVLCGLAFAMPIAAFTATQETDTRFPLVMRFVVLPLFLFSGTFFPISQLPDWLQHLAWISPLWHGVELCRAATTGRVDSAATLVAHVVVLLGCMAAGSWWGIRAFRARLAS